MLVVKPFYHARGLCVSALHELSGLEAPARITVMTIGDLVLMNSYVMGLAQPLEMLGHAARDVAQGLTPRRSWVSWDSKAQFLKRAWY